MSSSSSLMSLSPILLYAVASTLPITLIFLSIFLAPRLLNATRPDRGGRGDRSLSRSISVGLGLASTVSLVLYGICGLVSIGNGSLSAGIAAGILGALGLISSEFVHFERNRLCFRDAGTRAEADPIRLLSVDVQVALSTLWSGTREIGSKTRQFWWISTVSLLLLLSTSLFLSLEL